MKSNLQLIVAASALSVLTVSALAEHQTSTNQTDRRGHQTAANRLNGAAKSTELVGMEVKNYQDEKLGKVEDLAVDVESGRVVQVILSVGGFIGIGDRLTAVPPGALHHDVAQKVLHLDADKAKLKGAPEFEMSKWGENANSQYLSRVYGYYGQERAYDFVNGDWAAAPNAPKRNLDGTPDRNRLITDRQQIPTARLSSIQKASKLVGTAVKNSQDEKLGDVENLLVDLSSGRILAVVVSSGGFLGMGDELSAIPSSALSYSADHKSLQIDASKETLSKAPHFKSNQWPDFTHPGYAGGVYQAYNVAPYFDVNAEADNSARNVRDRNDAALTPLDQGNSKEDVNTTAQIRKQVLAAENLSIKAQNVKIITKNGNVTLRGPVDSEDEKVRIGEIARPLVAGGTVDNQLEVKTSAVNK